MPRAFFPRPMGLASMMVPVAALLAGCSLPLSPATAPVAGLAYGPMVFQMLAQDAAPAPPVAIHAEAGPSLTLDTLPAGLPDSDGGAIADITAWLAPWGLTPQHVERDEVIMARIGWAGSDPETRRSVYLPVLRGTQDAPAGSLLEVQIGPTGPAVVVATRASTPGEAGCVYHDLPTGFPTVERLNGRLLGSPRMTSVLNCDSLHTAKWQRAALFWHLEPPPAWPERRRNPEAPTRLDAASSLAQAGRVAVYRNVSVTMKAIRFPVFVDGQSVGELRDSSCMIFALAPGRHRITTGTGGFWGRPRRDIDVLLAVGEQAYVEFFVDDAVNYNFLLGLTHYGEYAERILRLVQRPMLTSVTGCTGVMPTSLEGVQPPRD